jgi:hypothetical protein
MSLASTVFNRGTLKVALALAIPTSIAYFFYYSQKQADLEISKVKTDQAAHPTATQMSIDDYTMKEVDDSNRIRWQLTSKSGTIMPNGSDVRLTEVVVEYYDPTTRQLKMRISAPDGMANQGTKFVRLSARNGQKVSAIGEGGKSKLVTSQLELTKKNQFTATGGVIIEWPGVAKVSGNSASGSTNLAAGPKDFKIIGNTNAEIAVR